MQKPQHSISRKLLTVLLIFLVIFLAIPITIFLVQHARGMQGSASSPRYTIYEDTLASGWKARSSASRLNFANTSPVYSGSKSISFTPTRQGARLYLYTNTAVDITSYAFFHFAAQASRAGQDVTVILYDAANKPLSTVHLAHYGGDPVPGTWKVYNIALSDLRANATHIKGVAIQSHIYGHGTLHLDSISLTEVVSSQASAPTANVMPIATLTLTPIPTITGVFTTLPPGAQLPSEVECAERVHRSSWEPRPDNYAANHRVPTAQQIADLSPWGPDNGQDAKVDTPGRQITGNFTGTTDEILQWASCKWGIDVNIVRAQAISESHWYQNDRGDQTNDASLCPPGTWNGTSCYQSYGIFQIKYIYNKTAWPMSRDDTAFNAEHTYASIRACYEGWRTYLYDRTPIVGYPRYHPGDIWGCVGSWYSGSWYDQGALNYIKSVKKYMANKQWLQPGF